MKRYICFTMNILLIVLVGIPASVRALPNQTLLSQVKLTPAIETAGLLVSGENVPGSADLFYRSEGSAEWRVGHPLMKLKNGQLAGSLFGLSPSTAYEVRIVANDAEWTGSFTTQADELAFTPSSIIYVDDNAALGGDGSPALPFRTIQEGVNHATPGTQVLVADGLYRETVSFPASGTEKNWIQVKAAGTGAVLEGADTITGKRWTALSGVNKVWYFKLATPIGYLARDKKRFYNYDTLAGLKKAVGHGGVTVKEGWFYDSVSKRLYIRSLDNPAYHSWQIPRFNHAFDVTARDWIWIEGFEMRFYGTRTDGCGVCALNASHLVIRKNKIHNMQLGVFINWNGTDEQGNDTRVEFNEIYDPPVNEWVWKSVKGSTMEGTGLIVRGHVGTIVRGNSIHNFFNGIYTGSSAAAALENPQVALDADIYNNRIQYISDDAFEPEGACVNHRFRNNTVDRAFVGISIAPVKVGPVWVVRNTVSSFTSTSIKWALEPGGLTLFYHNSFWTNASGLNAMSTITPSHNSIMRNNIFQGNGFAFEQAFTGSTGQDWDYDNWYTTRGTTGPHFKWENISYQTMPALCTGTGLECNGHESAPGFVSPATGNFTLIGGSPNIDAGVVIPGINDGFAGSAPDIGAFEFVP